MGRRARAGIGVVLVLVTPLASACGSNASASGSTQAKLSNPTGDAKLAKGFTLPSRNIFCDWQITKLRCDIGSGLQPPTAECPHESGLDAPPTLMTITRALGAGPQCTADIFAPVGRPTLAYGKMWRFHGILCLSQESGLVCVNQAGRGFFLSRERWAEF